VRQWNLNGIENTLVGVALTPALSTNALEIASNATGANGAVLVPLSSDVLPMISHTARMAGSHETYFKDSLYPQDQRYSTLPLPLRTGIADDFDALPTEQIKRHPRCPVFLAPDGLRRLAGVYLTSDTDMRLTSIERSVKNGPFSPNAIVQANSILEGIGIT
jgi:hypothetical protein